ncbi:MAG: TatD family hydrolase [Bacteroidales bacterium]|nr:TatD family hydrolase [Bacteroidales bacterium]
MERLRGYRDVHTHRMDAGPEAIINLPMGAEVPKDGSYSVGIHPWDTSQSDESIQQQMGWVAQCAIQPNIVAIGECGLDALRGAPLPDQERIFRWHIALSEQLQKPLILHVVKTADQIIRLRKELRPTQQWIVHGFRGKPQLAQQLLRAGIDISLGDKYNPETLAVIPPDRLYRDSD